MNHLKLFQFAIIKNEKTDRDGEVVEPASLLVPITAVMARDQEQATLMAGRAIPDTELDNLDRLTVVVRPF